MKADTKNEITYTALVKKAGLMAMISRLAGYQENCTENQAVLLHSGILKFGLSFKNAVQHLSSLGSVDDRVQRDKQKARAFAVLQTHASLSAQIAKLQDLRASVQQRETDAEPHNIKIFDDLCLDLLNLDSGGAFEGLMESDLIYDTLARHFHVHKESVRSLAGRIEKSLRCVTGDQDWKSTLVSSDPIEHVLETAAEKLIKLELKGGALKNAIEELDQELVIHRVYGYG